MPTNLELVINISSNNNKSNMSGHGEGVTAAGNGGAEGLRSNIHRVTRSCSTRTSQAAYHCDMANSLQQGIQRQHCEEILIEMHCQRVEHDCMDGEFE